MIGRLSTSRRFTAAGRNGLVLFTAAASLLAPVQTDAASPDESVSVLVARHCLECHNGSDRKGGLDLTRRATALKGGETGPALDPGHPDRSLLVERVEKGEMPPDGRAELAADQRALLRQWVAAGAKWSTDPIDPFLYSSDRRAGYNWWSLQPIRPVAIPAIQEPRSKNQDPRTKQR